MTFSDDGSNEQMSQQVKSEEKSILRSSAWFDNPHNTDMTAIYLERYLNFGLSRQELQSGRGRQR